MIETRLSPRRADDTPSDVRALIDRLPDGIIVVGRSDGCIWFANPAAEKLFGRPAQELVRHEFGFPLADEASEIEIVRRGGETVTAELRAEDIEWEGQPGILVSLRDVTDRKRAEERARQLARERAARAEAEAASQAKSEFFATMSHELRTPLNAVLGYAELLEMGTGGPLTQEQQRQLSRIRSSGRHLLQLVNEVLDLAKADAGRLRVERRVNSAAAVANSALALVVPNAQARGISMRPNVKDYGDGFYGDENRVRQILVNLLTNAVKFTAPGGSVNVDIVRSESPAGNVHVSGDRTWTCFRVSDTGIGIPAHQQESIFDPFVQAEGGTTRSNDGSGLGLTISRRLARLMGGDLTVQSEPGKGSTFSLWLPAAPIEADAPTVREIPVQAENRETRGPGLALVGGLLLRLVEPILDSFVQRLRDEPVTPSAPRLKPSQLADHVSCYVADLATLLIALDESGGEPSPLVADAHDLHRLIADRHGAQRARLEWTAEALRKEYAILGEEIDRALRAAVPAHGAAVDRALEIIHSSLAQAEELSVQALERPNG